MMLHRTLSTFVSALVLGTLAFSATPALAQYNAFKDPTASSAKADGQADFKAVSDTIQGGKIAVGGTSYVVALFKNQSSSQVTVGKVNLYQSSNVSASVSLNQCADTPLSPDAQCAITIAVKGLVSGSWRVDALVDHSGRSRIASASMTGEVEQAPEQKTAAKGDIEVTPAALDFGTSPGGIAQVRPLTLKNMTAEDITISSITLDGPDKSGFSYKSECPGALKPGASCNVIVTWQPTSKGLAQGVLIARHSGKSGMVQAEVKGVLQPQADASKEASGNVELMPASLDFGTSAGGIALKKSVVLANRSAENVEIWDIGLDVPEGSGYTFSSQCPDTLRPDEICNVIVTWQPLSAGLAQGVLSVQHSGKSGVSQAEVKGVYQPAATPAKNTASRVDIVPENMDFGTSAGGIALVRSFIITNHLTEAVKVQDITLNAPEQSGFSYKTQCPALLAPEGMCNVIVTWEPTTKGIAQGVLVLQHSGKGGIVQAELKGTFQPPANASSKDASGKVGIMPESLDFGTSPGGLAMMRSFVISNHSSQEVEIWDVELKVPEKSGMSYESQCPDTLRPEESCNVILSWEPSTKGLSQGVLVVQHSGKSGMTQAEVKGVYQPAAEDKAKDPAAVDAVVATPPTLDFGDSPGGISAVRSIILTNNSTKTVDIKNVNLDVPEQAGFSYKSECPSSLPAGQACNIIITWSPTVKGTAQGVLIVQHTGKTGMTQVDVKGSLKPQEGKSAAIYPEVVPDRGLLVSDREKIDFGTGIKEESAITTTFVNAGSSPLTIKSISLSGVQNDLELSDTGCVPDLVLAPGAACPLTMTWLPGKGGTILDSLQIIHSGTRGVLVIPVQGTAADPAAAAGGATGAAGALGSGNAGGAAAGGATAGGASAALAAGGGNAAVPAVRAAEAPPSFKQTVKNYKITSHSATRAVMNGPDGGQVVRDGEDIVINGMKVTVTIVPLGVILTSNGEKVTLPFDSSLKLLDQGATSAKTAAPSEAPADVAPAPSAAAGGSLMPPSLLQPPVR